MKKKARKALIKMFKEMVNEERITDLETGINPFVFIGEPVKAQMVITYIVKSKE